MIHPLRARLFRTRFFQALFLSLWAASGAEILRAEVIINEFMAVGSERRLTWGEDGAPRMGSGPQWKDPDYQVPGWWTNGLLPAGYGFTGLATQLTSVMKDKTPSLYLRKEFVLPFDLATATNTLVLTVQIDDGFIAYLNGKEVARANAGPTNHFMYASQPAYNVVTTTNVVEYKLSSAAAWLHAGTNLLAIQAHNAEKPSTASAPQQISAHTPTPEFRANAGLRIDGDGSVTNLVPLGATGGSWQYFVGRFEPAGGVADPGLATKAFTPPVGEEDDYEQPAQFADWIELYNPHAVSVNLGGWGLSDDCATPMKWRFPADTVIAAGGYLVVLCDDREEANPPAGPAQYLHTNFKLNNSGECLTLCDSSGRWIDGLPAGYPPQTSSCSYGRQPGNLQNLGFFTRATPGARNSGPFFEQQVSSVEFIATNGSPLPGGLYTVQPLALALRCNTPGAEIRYTLNGTEPTETSGTVYSTPFALSQSLEKTGFIVRARAFKTGLLPSRTETHSYLLKQPSLLKNNPILMLGGDPGRTFYLPTGVLSIRGGSFPSGVWQTGGPTTYNMAEGNGVPFEREMQLEYYFPASYYPAGQQPLRTGAGIRLSASPWQRPRMKLDNTSASPWPPGDTTQKPSFNVYFAGEYGLSQADYPFFTNYPVSQFQNLRLRAGKNDNYNPFVTDELARRLYIDMGHVGARGFFCSLYVNAVYRGVYNVCERVREPFFQAHYGSEAEWDVNYTYSWVNGDSIAYQQMLAALDRNLTNAVNWSYATNLIDVDNAADYYLLNVYGATWDWPHNNFVMARERSTGPLSRFRYTLWDSEGMFNVVNQKPPSYNTITTDLLGGTSDLARIFKRLVTAPEFRLLFADHVNSRMFNRGILDDRDPDGAGPLKSHFRTRLDELSKEAGSLVQYNTGAALNTNPFLQWTATASGRRSYLLGTTAGRRMLRDAGLWPVTEPPVFSQFGGAVAPGFALTMTSTVAVTNQASSIYYTVNGSDPRLAGGAINPVAQLYADPVPLSQVTTVKARAKNNVTGEWSAITSATFVTDAAEPTTENIVVAELMYHPPAPTTAETAAGFTNEDDFEFIRLINIGESPVDLTGLHLSAGVLFDFGTGAVKYLASGSSVLAVRNKNAFRKRYGNSCDAFIAGEYLGSLSNSGERIQLTNSVSVLRDFSYTDMAPWPSAADGQGPSLLLREPFKNPDHANAWNWTVSAIPGGLPAGYATQQTYSAWRNLYWTGTAATNELLSRGSADPDGDGICNYLEYAFGLSPAAVTPTPRCVPELTWVGSDPCLSATIRMNPGAASAKLTWECTSDSVAWIPDTSMEVVDIEPQPDGTALLHYLSNAPITDSGRLLRLKVTVGN